MNVRSTVHSTSARVLTGEIALSPLSPTLYPDTRLKNVL